MYEAVAEKIIAQLKEGTAPWQQPWEKSGAAFEKPFNAVTNKAYRGFEFPLTCNSLPLLKILAGPPSNKPNLRAGRCKKGAKGMAINFVKTHEIYPKRDEQGKPVFGIRAGKPVKSFVGY